MTAKEPTLLLFGSLCVGDSGTAAIPIANPFSFNPSKGIEGAFSKGFRPLRSRSISWVTAGASKKYARSTIDTEAYPSGGSVKSKRAGLKSQSKLRPYIPPCALARAVNREHAHNGVGFSNSKLDRWYSFAPGATKAASRWGPWYCITYSG